MKQTFLLAGVLGAGVGVAHWAAQDPPAAVRPEARAETAPVPNRGDAADDPEVWVHPSERQLSLILGTDKRGGLLAYNMDGTLHQEVPGEFRPNNVDVLYGFSLEGRTVDLAVASAQARRRRGVKVWAITPDRRLTDVTEGGSIPVLDGGTPFGACAYRSPRTGRAYVFVTGGKGEVEQYELLAGSGGTVGGRKVRELRLRSLAEGCAADHDLGFLYLAEETRGVWKFGAEPGAGGEGRLIARVGEHGLTADVEGLTLYYAGNGRGYLIASSQGNNTFKVYERGGENRYLLTIDPREGRIDDVNDTDGIAVTSCPTSREFARGLFIVQDGGNPGGNQNFKLYGWEDIAGTRLLVDTACRINRAGASPRPRRRRS